jgi:hypothetical protein
MGYRNAFSAAVFNRSALMKGTEIAFLRASFLSVYNPFNLAPAGSILIRRMYYFAFAS